MCIQEELSGAVYLYLSSQQGLIRIQLICHQRGAPSAFRNNKLYSSDTVCNPVEASAEKGWERVRQSLRMRALRIGVLLPSL